MPPSTALGFTKLVVYDLEKLVVFYCEAYGLHAVKRVRGEKVGDEEIDEVMLASEPDAPFGSFVLLKYVGRPASPTGELLLGFVTENLPALLDRICAAGGAIHDPMREISALGIRVAFATDPEGHLAELVQLVS
jgi:predicted enzyme related to lactoylglutathione lyase